jgi:kinesin family member 11
LLNNLSYLICQVSELPDTAGVIPRAVCHIFEILTARRADYSMKVTFLELYNEDITDLLSLEDQSRFPEGRQKRPITLMEDGKGGAVIRGLEEIVVYSPSDIYSLLEHGSARRRTADTALNKQSRFLIILFLPSFGTEVVICQGLSTLHYVHAADHMLFFL